MISSNIARYFALHMSVANNSSILEFLDLRLQVRSVLMCMPNQLAVSHKFYSILKRALTRFLKGLH